jgi:CRP-like cAMP-binding protein
VTHITFFEFSDADNRVVTRQSLGLAAGFSDEITGQIMKTQSFAADDQLIQALRWRSAPIACSEGRTLFTQGENPDGIYILEDGEAAMVLNSTSGRTVMCLHAGSGSLLGLPAVVAGEPYSLTAMAKPGSTIRFVTRDDFEKMIEAEPDLYPSVLRVLAAEVRAARQALSET